MYIIKNIYTGICVYVCVRVYLFIFMYVKYGITPILGETTRATKLDHVPRGWKVGMKPSTTWSSLKLLAFGRSIRRPLLGSIAAAHHHCRKNPEDMGSTGGSAPPGPKDVQHRTWFDAHFWWFSENLVVLKWSPNKGYTWDIGCIELQDV